MKPTLVISFLLIFIMGLAQGKVPPSEQVRIYGRVRSEMNFRVNELEKMPARDIGNVIITNHMGEAKGTAKAMKGVALRDLLKNLEPDSDSPKMNSAYFLVFKGSDGYTVVYSWNEIMNNAIGLNSFVVTEKEGKKMKDMEERILVITPSDEKTGRRYIKGLTSIFIGRAE